MSLFSALAKMRILGESLVLLGRVIGDLGMAFIGRPRSASDGEQDSLTHGVESEKPEDDTQYDLFNDSDSTESRRRG